MQQHELPTISRFGNDLTFEPKTRNNGKQLARSKIDSNFKPLSSVCESFPSILICMQNSLFCLQNCIPSILIDLRARVFSTIDKYQKPHVLVAKLFIIYTRTCSGSYAISWLECRQTNMFDAKTVILYWTSNIVITNVHSTTVLLCEIHVDSLMGTATLTLRLYVQHLIKA